MSVRSEPGARAVAAPARSLIIVRQDQLALYRHLAARFADLAFVEVVLDRRGAERRRRPAPVDAERRRGDRRRPTVPGERTHWLAFGYRLVRREEAS